jgi:acylphosphatase
MKVARRYRVHGRVQGVGFRAFVWRQAGSLGVDGWARNCADGTVEVLAAADEATLAELVGKLQQGPLWSRVDRVEVSETEAADVGLGFAILRDA